MPTPSPRPRARVAATAALTLISGLGAGLGPAAAAPLSTVAGVSAVPASTPAFTAGTDRTAPGHVSGAAVQAAAVVPSMVQLATAQECPTGTRRTATLLREGFEGGTLPEKDYTDGWQVVTDTPRTGARAARSVISSGDTTTQPTTPPYWAMGLPFLTTPGGRTILRFAIKGNYPEEAASVSVNDSSGFVSPSAQWGVVTLDATNAITAADASQLDIRFANYPETTTTTSTVDLDDIEVYTCAAPTPSRVRGDFTSDGIADLVTVNAAGVLQVWPGTGALKVGAAIAAGQGWGSATWLGSAGDMNGDGRADLLARFSSGDLFVYYGDGVGAFTRGTRQVGVGWNGMKDIIAMGDVNADRLTDFYARDAKNAVRRYWLSSSGVLTGGTIVGVGFGGFSSLFSMGDVNRDGRYDVTGIQTNGDMKLFTTLATGAMRNGPQIGNGWNFRQVTSSGDYNRNGLPDVLALDAAGNLFTYPVLGSGKWGARVQTGLGFGTFKLVM